MGNIVSDRASVLLKKNGKGDLVLVGDGVTNIEMAVNPKYTLTNEKYKKKYVQATIKLKENKGKGEDNGLDEIDVTVTNPSGTQTVPKIPVVPEEEDEPDAAS